MVSDVVDIENITTDLWCFVVGTSWWVAVLCGIRCCRYREHYYTALRCFVVGKSWWVAILCGIRCGRHREHYYSSVVFCCRDELVGGRSLWYQMW